MQPLPVVFFRFLLLRQLASNCQGLEIFPILPLTQLPRPLARRVLCVLGVIRFFLLFPLFLRPFPPFSTSSFSPFS